MKKTTKTCFDLYFLSILSLLPPKKTWGIAVFTHRCAAWCGLWPFSLTKSPWWSLKFATNQEKHEELNFLGKHWKHDEHMWWHCECLGCDAIWHVDILYWLCYNILCYNVVYPTVQKHDSTIQYCTVPVHSTILQHNTTLSYILLWSTAYYRP